MVPSRLTNETLHGLTMRTLPPRLPSRSAAIAYRLAQFLPVLGVVVIIAQRVRLIDAEAFGILFWFVLGLVVLTLAMTMRAFYSLWTTGRKGGRKASAALFLCLLVLVPYGWMAARTLTMPQQADTATDLIVPPLFVEDLRSIDGDARAIVAASLKDGYPELVGQRFQSDMDAVVSGLSGAAAQLGLVRRVQRGRIGANNDVFVEYVWQTAILKWPHELVVRLTDEGEATFVDIRSRSIDRTHDFGLNAEMIARLQSLMDAELIRPESR